MDFACGSKHALCALESEGQTEVWGWGWNEPGNLATGSLNDVRPIVRICPLRPEERRRERRLGRGLGVGRPGLRSLFRRLSTTLDKLIGEADARQARAQGNTAILLPKGEDRNTPKLARILCSHWLGYYSRPGIAP